MIAAIVFPHQLFKQHPALDKANKVYLVEEWLFFKQYKFHKQKIVLHRASMQFYRSWLEENGYIVEYIESTNAHAEVRKLIAHLSKQGVTEIHNADVVDDWLRKRFQHACKKHAIETVEHETPMFLNTLNGVSKFFENRKTYFQTDFYIKQRKQRNILIEANNQPAGGKWSFDAENRLKFPKNEKLPAYNFPKENKYVKEARSYVVKYFSHHYGLADAPFNTVNSFYPVTFTEAEKWLHGFLLERLPNFGKYEDAMVANQSILYHSVLSPLLNIGLITPQQVIDETLKIYQRQKLPLNSVEGFIRQIIGWRDFIRIVYEREGRKQRTTNYWGFTRKIPASFWKGETGIVPVDNVINHVLQNAYSHHIERLMVLGNFMLLCEFDPNDVYKWFMEMYIDAYDWVMVPNVYGMTQFADGGLITTKPYISGSNYILKMSDYKNAKAVNEHTWQEIWDGLFWRFMHVHSNYFQSNPRIGMLLKTFQKMPAEKRNQHLQVAEDFLQLLDARNK
ncbi:cryptochrome/photolyase family protein [Panacibacter ginsenosidivorans]|uniref:Cryptochrome/photolyase family protein n=1 Tax=Panacibacter ginsenosidivorans TaxID=1813871 RepID=A0A5B8V6Y0_9BACT|nr:cryptochrome/photolyase family protein [Panacibacter ginsenosidivorans]QEC66885.1 cryptochrome/photolyase family protein [Panacibacter ginsenosidivorans]